MPNVPRTIAAPLAVLASMSIIVMMLAISVEVVYRNITGKSIPGVLELSESAVVATVFLGLAYAATSGSHIAVDLLVDRLPKLIARALITLAWLLSAREITDFDGSDMHDEAHAGVTGALRTIHMVGRSDPEYAKFDPVMVRELTGVAGIDQVVHGVSEMTSTPGKDAGVDAIRELTASPDGSPRVTINSWFGLMSARDPLRRPGQHPFGDLHPRG